MNQLLTTGGAGFPGYHLTHHFANKGATIVLLDFTLYEVGEYHIGTKIDTGYMCHHEQEHAALEKAQPRRGIHSATALSLWKPADIFSKAEALIRSYQWYVEHALGLEVIIDVTYCDAREQGTLKVFKWVLGGRN